MNPASDERVRIDVELNNTLGRNTTVAAVQAEGAALLPEKEPGRQAGVYLSN